jgi:hypothetical protein
MSPFSSALPPFVIPNLCTSVLPILRIPVLPVLYTPGFRVLSASVHSVGRTLVLLEQHSYILTHSYILSPFQPIYLSVAFICRGFLLPPRHSALLGGAAGGGGVSLALPKLHPHLLHVPVLPVLPTPVFPVLHASVYPVLSTLVHLIQQTSVLPVLHTSDPRTLHTLVPSLPYLTLTPSSTSLIAQSI